MSEIISILNKIQQELNVPKNQTNTFGGYKYRSCEDILSAVKPLLGDCILAINDGIEMIGDRYYVRAVAKLSNKDGFVETTAYAREPEVKKGMDESQITGTASSYARKYALNGLFAIDDTKDSDTDEHHRQTDGNGATKAPVSSPKPTTAPTTEEPKDYTFNNVGALEEPFEGEVPCKACGGKTTYKEFTSKAGNFVKGYFCNINKDHKPFFVK